MELIGPKLLFKPHFIQVGSTVRLRPKGVLFYVNFAVYKRAEKFAFFKMLNGPGNSDDLILLFLALFTRYKKDATFVLGIWKGFH